MTRTPIDYAELVRSTRSRSNGLPLVRAAAAHLIAKIEPSYPADVIARLWPRDDDAKLIAKAASSPATITGAGWANTLAETAVADFIVSMGPASAGAALLARGLQLQFDSRAGIMVPGMLASASNASFVQEAAPIPVRALSLDGPTLSPHKFATISVFTREIFQHSTPTIEALTRIVLTESIGLALDASLLDANAADATRPAGLRFGIAGLTASNNADSREAMVEDVRTLIAAVAPIAGNGPFAFVASPTQATALRLWSPTPDAFRREILASSSLAPGTLICIAPTALVSALDPAPRFEISTEGTLHMETVPLPFASTGTPNTIAAPMRSLYQTDTMGLRAVMQVAWALRNSGGLAWLTTTKW